MKNMERIGGKTLAPHYSHQLQKLCGRYFFESEIYME
jgi:hypothetical protein